MKLSYYDSIEQFMARSVEKALRRNPRSYITDAELAVLLGGTSDSRYSKVKRLVAQDQLIHIRRGLYCLTEALGFPTKPHPFELAQLIYAPSYISLESALAYHQLIPEAVYVTTSVCTKRSKVFHTPLGEFSYLHLPRENFYAEVELIIENDYRFFIAKPWKAICDYVFCYKKDGSQLAPLLQNLRISHEDLPMLHEEERDRLDEYYRHSRLTRFLKNVKRELNQMRFKHNER
jgi:predicted transcriptional regulator of viral defense system